MPFFRCCIERKLHGHILSSLFRVENQSSSSLGRQNLDLLFYGMKLSSDGRGGGRWIIGGGAHIYIFVFTDCKSNRFQKKLVVQNTNI